jgi:hypothetical protein
MIRHRRGDEFLLVAQHDHALLSGEFATHVGGGGIGAGGFARPDPFRQTVDGIALHDCGWPLHDDRPTLNDKGLPLHVLESPMPIAIKVWSESARRAAEKDPYTGLLVSLHVMALSFIAQTKDPTPHERYQDAKDLFDLNKFQHRQAELQEQLRRRIGLRTDIPLTKGLAKPGVDPAEDLLLFDYNLLKTCDRLSLDLCCSEPLFETIEEVFPRPGAMPITLHLGHVAESSMTVHPWPFDADRLEYELPCRRLPATPFTSDHDFQQAFAAAPRDTLHVRLAPG